MSEENLPAVAQNTEVMKPEQGLSLPPEFMGFSPDEALGGMDEVYQGYVKQYPFFMRSNNAGQFEMRDNATDKIVFESKLGETLKCVIIFAHHTRVLLAGNRDNRQDDIDLWPDEAKEVLAMSYDDKSPGNFTLNGLGEYLNKPKREAVSSKLNLIAVFPELESGAQPVFCSFGITSDDYKRPNTLASIRLELDQFNRKNGANIPLNFLVSEMFFVSDENKEKTKKYQRPGFALAKNGGTPVPAFASVDVYRVNVTGYHLLQEVIARHKKAVRAKETDLRVVAPVTAPAVVEYNGEFDDIPM